MTLVDIGNSSIDIFDGNSIKKIQLEQFDTLYNYQEIYYINVNSKIATPDDWINLKEYIDYSRYYSTMGIDRIVACEAISDGVVVDCGSAITIDIISNSIYMGGSISLGIKKAKKSLVELSDRLNLEFNFDIDLDKMARNSSDSITLGYFKPLVEYINSFDATIYLTGGDREVFKSFLPKAIVVEDLVFQGMKKIIKKGIKC